MSLKAGAVFSRTLQQSHIFRENAMSNVVFLTEGTFPISYCLRLF